MTITKSSKDDAVVNLEMTTPELAILTTMVGYACAAAEVRGHVEALRMFASFAKKMSTCMEEINGKNRSRTKKESN
jgi:hypothetical protein